MEERGRAEESRRDADVLQKFGGNNLKILSFYASPPAIRRGQVALLCYGVSNAAKVRISPAVESLAPSLSRCFEIRPASTTTFVLTCEDAQGHHATQSVVVEVASSEGAP